MECYTLKWEVLLLLMNFSKKCLYLCAPMLKTINILNKRAKFDYEIIDTYTAGIVLTGTEIKSIRLGDRKSVV